MLDIDRRVNAQILWYRNNNLITPDSYRQLLNNNQTLKFTPIRSLEDEGQFTCRVFSEAGNATQSYSITVVNVPTRVEPTAQLSTDRTRSITISWTAPRDGNSPIRRYIIRYRENSTCKFHIHISVQSNFVTNHIVKTQCFTNFILRINSWKLIDSVVLCVTLVIVWQSVDGFKITLCTVSQYL